MGNILEGIINKQINRRNFLKASAIGAAGLALPGCSSSTLTNTGVDATADGNEGQWITAACWHNCGGRCLNKALVVDGVVVRQKTDDTHEDSPDFPQQRGCARGRSHRKMVMGADRLKYPMKRKNWAPGGGNKELRGQDEWVRISWDEALDIMASELTRIKDAYGNRAIFAPVGGSDSLQAVPRLLSAFGGYTARWGSVSWGSWPTVYSKVTGQPHNGASDGNDRFRLRESKLIILWGANPAQSSQGLPAYNYLQAKKAGVKFIVIDPIYSESARVLADEWIPIRPATDTALILGMAYYIIKNNLLDQNFLDNCTIGFDADHLPEGADPKDNFKDYVLGTYDNTPKTPEWAAEICGVPAVKIAEFAQEYATTKPAAIISGGAPARINNGEHLPHAMMTLAYMVGNVGIPGAGVSPNMHNSATNAGPALVKAGGNGLPKIVNPIDDNINSGEMYDAILNGKYIKQKGEIRDINIQMIWTWFSHNLNQRAGSSQGIDAYRKVEFVVAQNMFLTADAQYADLVLPVTSEWERLGGLLTGNREILIHYRQIVEPQYEAKSDLWIVKEIGKKLGIDPTKVCPVSEEQQMYNQLAGAEVIKEDGSGYEKLLTLTAEDIKALGAEGEPQTGRITYQEFKEKGIYQVPRHKGDKLEFTSFEDFVADPASHKVNTPSGKFEIYCKSLADNIEKVGFTSKSPIPKYEPSVEGYEDGQKNGYPFQLITIHYFRRSHSTLDNVTWLREAFNQECRLNAQDAAELGIKTGDIVKVTSQHGSVIRPVYVTETITPGVVSLGEGAWIDMDEGNGVDKAGCTGILNGPIATGQGHTGYNSCNVKVEKYDKPLALDVNWPQRIIL
ncbi:Dimethyl sulfoxide reductase DmsA [bioreactor metagenome]|uniref:Dimethyl sulfoxide reductase DmsA n=1 Tax=bioreactor metagenome TaxID=1076179 RepID=A0A644TWP1_9ZZZZ|nr:dimethyl sulfoxide reductase subunit A [Desulfitobacterium hafniense]MEA5022078.1 dimethyl sulfoxide reductase subunit A [Desulfitobacterium hafniense]